jgi:hypothetical protein
MYHSAIPKVQYRVVECLYIQYISTSMSTALYILYDYDTVLLYVCTYDTPSYSTVRL